jgi:hypothetical protein
MKALGMILYKYRDVTPRSLAILSNQELYFARPADLNDPLDGQINIHAIYSSLRQFMQTLDGEVGLKLGFLVHILNEHKFAPKADNKRTLSLTEAMLDFVRALGICSLSKTPNDALLWSHYGGGHTGFCIGFEESDLKLEGVFIRDEVEYFSSPPNRQIFLDLASELGDLVRPWDSAFKSDDEATDHFYSKQISRLMRANLLIKSDLWRYEREYRLIRHEAGLAKFAPSSVREIVFGLKTSEATRRSVIRILSDPVWAHVKIRRVHQDSTSFDFMVLRESFCEPSEYLKAFGPEKQ